MTKESIKKYLIEKFDDCHDFCKRNWNDISVVLTIIGISSIIVIVLCTYMTYQNLTSYKPTKFQHDVSSTQTIIVQDTSTYCIKPVNYVKDDSDRHIKDDTINEDTTTNETDD
jgi:hypothetical protein